MIEKLFENRQIELDEFTLAHLTKNLGIIKIPSKVEDVVNRINKTELLDIADDVLEAKELIFMVVSNLSDSFITACKSNATESQKKGFKTLNSKVLKNQTRVKNKYTYTKIINLLVKIGVFEKGRNYSVGNRSNEFRLTDKYFGKGIVEYKAKSRCVLSKIKNREIKNIELISESSIATNELINFSKIVFPTDEEAVEFLLKTPKNKRGDSIVMLGKSNREGFKNCVFIEDYVQILRYLRNMAIPIVTSSKGGHRVITAYNLLPSVLRPLVKFKGEVSVESDYTCLHPNIVNFIYKGSGRTVTHEEVAKFLNISKLEAKIEHLSFFNKKWSAMINSSVFKYYWLNERSMMMNIFNRKEELGYKSTSEDCFYFETKLMEQNIKDLTGMGIDVLYCFDCLYSNKANQKTVKEVMDRNAKLFGINTKIN